MGRRMTAVAWLERHYDGMFDEGRGIVMPTDSDMTGLHVTSYVPDCGDERYDHGPLLSIKRDPLDDEYAWPAAASWPDPEPEDNLDDHEGGDS
ncbi:hypothetical protein [Streptomyces halobius]|uniref:Uncharacterized protein n=1 Tax=Streptomyces halobius TaxID=2879846 RepID=A0ABY4M203_9ACTN|nr:hypothetical protein [Streptomyces halobius]UQA91213.1 hypothetical protein K9S39_04385 [Streptomyces halobius]